MEPVQEQHRHLEDLQQIRSMMEKSSRFISLSGLSGVFVGIFALLGLGALYWAFDTKVDIFGWSAIYNPSDWPYRHGLTYTRHFAFFDAAIVLILSVGAATLLTIRRTKKTGGRIWDGTTKRLMVNMLVPLVAGGVFCLILAHHLIFGLEPAATLIFYGIALFNAGKYTLNDIRYLGIIDICLGLLAAWLTQYSLIFWAVGFGLMHILYGIMMYFKYER